MLSLIRRIFGPIRARFSKDLRATVGYSQRVAIACGATEISTAHLLAAIARHPAGNELLDGHAHDVFQIVCDKIRTTAPTPDSANNRLESATELKELIERLAGEGLAASTRWCPYTIGLADTVRVMRQMPETSAYAVLKKCGLVSLEEKV